MRVRSVLMRKSPQRCSTTASYGMEAGGIRITRPGLSDRTNSARLQHAILRFEGGSEKRGELPAVHVFVRAFTGGVVPAGQDDYLVIKMMAGEFADHFPGKFRQESKIIFRVHHERTLGIPRELFEVHHGTDGEPEVPQAFQIDGSFETFADVACGLAMPDYVSEVSGGMVEGRGPDALVVRAGNEGITGTKARARDPESIVTLLFEPIEAAADVDHALADGVESTPDVGRDGVIGAADFRRHTNVVIRHAEPKHG